MPNIVCLTICDLIIFSVIIIVLFCLIRTLFSSETKQNKNKQQKRYVLGYVYRNNCPRCQVFRNHWSTMRNNLHQYVDLYEYNLEKWWRCMNNNVKNNIDYLFKMKSQNENINLPYVFIYDWVNNET